MIEHLVRDVVQACESAYLRKLVVSFANQPSIMTEFKSACQWAGTDCFGGGDRSLPAAGIDCCGGADTTGCGVGSGACDSMSDSALSGKDAAVALDEIEAGELESPGKVFLADNSPSVGSTDACVF